MYKVHYVKVLPKTAVVPEIPWWIDRDRAIFWHFFQQHTFNIAEHLPVKMICSRWIPHTRFVSIAVKKCWKKYYGGASKDVESNQRKLFVEKSLQSKCWPVSSTKLVMWRLFHFVGYLHLSGAPQFVCWSLRRNSKNKQEKTSSHTSAQTIVLLLCLLTW